MLTCSAAAPLIDAFIDGELAPSDLLEVARHAGQCAQCEGAVRELLAVRDGIVSDSDRLVDGLDFGRVWPRVETAIARTDAQADWRRRVDARRGVASRRVTVWASVAAIAATAVLMVRPAQQPGGVAKNPQTASIHGTEKRLPNHVFIDRLAGKDIALRREPKSGTTMIWVNHEVDGSGW
jgi:anti-sigma factor RsiW